MSCCCCAHFIEILYYIWDLLVAFFVTLLGGLDLIEKNSFYPMVGGLDENSQNKCEYGSTRKLWISCNGYANPTVQSIFWFGVAFWSCVTLVHILYKGCKSCDSQWSICVKRIINWLFLLIALGINVLIIFISCSYTNKYYTEGDFDLLTTVSFCGQAIFYALVSSDSIISFVAKQEFNQKINLSTLAAGFATHVTSSCCIPGQPQSPKQPGADFKHSLAFFPAFFATYFGGLHLVELNTFYHVTGGLTDEAGNTCSYGHRDEWYSCNGLDIPTVKVIFWFGAAFWISFFIFQVIILLCYDKETCLGVFCFGERFYEPEKGWISFVNTLFIVGIAFIFNCCIMGYSISYSVQFYNKGYLTTVDVMENFLQSVYFPIKSFSATINYFSKDGDGAGVLFLEALKTCCGKKDENTDNTFLIEMSQN